MKKNSNLDNYWGNRATLQFIVCLPIFAVSLFFLVGILRAERGTFTGLPDKCYFDEQATVSPGRLIALVVEIGERRFTCDIDMEDKKEVTPFLEIGGYVANKEKKKRGGTAQVLTDDEYLPVVEMIKRLKYSASQIDTLTFDYTGGVIDRIEINKVEIYTSWNIAWVLALITLLSGAASVGLILFFIKDPLKVYHWKR